MTTEVSVDYKLLGFLRVLFRNGTRIKVVIFTVQACKTRGQIQRCAPRVGGVVLHFFIVKDNHCNITLFLHCRDLGYHCT